MEHVWMAASRDIYLNSATNHARMEPLGHIAVYIVENVVAWDNVIILMELATLVVRSGTVVQNAWRNVQGVCSEKDVQANVDNVQLIYSVIIYMGLV